MAFVDLLKCQLVGRLTGIGSGLVRKLPARLALFAVARLLQFSILSVLTRECGRVVLTNDVDALGS